MYNKKESIEDYLEKILMLNEEKELVRAIDLAKFMGFSKASVSIALKKLKSYGYVLVDDDTGAITLTQEGETIARSTYERHTLIAQTLIKIGVSEKTAYEDACAIEHILSEETFNIIKERCKNWKK